MVVVEHAYASDDLVIEAVGRVTRGGVVDVVLPECNRLLDIAPTRHCTYSRYFSMLRALDILVEETIAAVGSTNLTPRSMRTAREIALFLGAVDELRFVRELGRRLAPDVAKERAGGGALRPRANG